MEKEMIHLRNISHDHVVGYKLILLWFISLSIFHQDKAGGHITLSGSVGPIGISVNFSFFNTLLP